MDEGSRAGTLTLTAEYITLALALLCSSVAPKNKSLMQKSPLKK